MQIKRYLAAAAMAAAAVLWPGCHHIDHNLLNVSYVNVTFTTIGDWTVYGVSGAGQYKRFILQQRLPAGFPYTAMSSTGLGGILLCTTYTAQPVAYDLACPVEKRADVRVAVGDDNLARCPKCGSCYDIFELPGHPVSGPAADQGCGLQIYSVHPGGNGEYMVISL